MSVADLTRLAHGTNNLIDSEKTYTWASSATANTDKSNTFTIVNHKLDGIYVIHVYNPSAVTALTVKCINTESLNGSDRDCELARFSVPASSSRAFVIQGFGVGSGTPKITMSNDTVLGGSDGFSAYLRLRDL